MSKHSPIHIAKPRPPLSDDTRNRGTVPDFVTASPRPNAATAEPCDNRVAKGAELS